MIIIIVTFLVVIIATIFFILFTQQSLIDLKQTPILAIGLYHANIQELDTVRHQFKQDSSLKKIAREYFVLIYVSTDQTKIEVFGNDLKKTEYEQLRKLLV